MRKCCTVTRKVTVPQRFLQIVELSVCTELAFKRLVSNFVLTCDLVLALHAAFIDGPCVACNIQ